MWTIGIIIPEMWTIGIIIPEIWTIGIIMPLYKTKVILVIQIPIEESHWSLL
jgi:hypothetical protein